MLSAHLNLKFFTPLFFGVIGCLLVPASYAKTFKQTQLSISPQLCISSPEQPECQLTLKLEWQYSGKEPVCIVSDYPNLEKWCAGSAEVKFWAVTVTTKKDIHFMLVNQNNHPLAGVKFKVTPVTEPQVRRRYRNPWSLF